MSITISNYSVFEEANKIIKQVYGPNAKFRGQYEAIEPVLSSNHQKRLRELQTH